MEKKSGKVGSKVLDRLQKQQSRKSIITIVIALIILAIIIILGFSFIKYFKSSEKQLSLGANIENVSVSEDGKAAYIKLAGGSDKNITKIRFIFKDKKGNEHYYETSEGISEISVPFKRGFVDWLLGRQFKAEYDYQINSEEVGLDGFEDVEEVSVVFEYETEEGKKIETPKLDTAKPKSATRTTTPAGGGGAGGGGPRGDGVCSPKTCSVSDCGIINDGCGGSLDCGACPGPCAGVTECGNYTFANCTNNPCLIGGGCEWNGTSGVCEAAVVITYYVSINDPSCDDSGNGTSAVPWCNLNRSYTWYAGAGPKVQEGDTVLFRDGDYGRFSESTDYGSGRLFYRNNWITYKADAGYNPTLTGIDVRNEDKWGPVEERENGRSYLIFDGFEVMGAVSSHLTSYVQVFNSIINPSPLPYEGFYAPYYRSTGVNVDNGHYITIEGNEIMSARRGISLSGTNAVIRNNLIHRLGEDGISGALGSYLLIEGNTIYDLLNLRTYMRIPGDKSGDFIEGENVTMVGTSARGIVYKWLTDHLLVYQTTETSFKEEWNINNSRIVRGENSGATVSNITDIDPAHTDGIQFDAGNKSYIVIRGNTVIRTHGHQGIKLETRGVSKYKDVIFENNLVWAKKPIMGRADADIINFNNNTLYSIVNGSEGSGIVNPDLNITNMYNNIFGSGLSFTNVTNHGNNIFRYEPGFNKTSTEIVYYSVEDLFVDAANGNFSPLMSSPVCDGGVTGSPYWESGSYVGALPCVPECIDEQTRNCSKQLGVCAGCSETCIGGGWPGCDDTTYLACDLNYNSTEICADSWDNDCDGCTDNVDSNCDGLETNCTDNIDNNCDGSTDCADNDCVGTPECPFSLAGIVSWWKFENNANDGMGMYDGTIFGDPQFLIGQQGQALDFDGDDYVENTEWNALTNFTVSLWFYPHNDYDADVYEPLLSWDSGEDEYEWKLVKRADHTNENFDNSFGLRWDAGPTGTNHRKMYKSSSRWQQNTWQHVVIVQENLTATMYYNGSVQTWDYITGNEPLPEGTRPLYIGGASANLFNGTVDEVMIYNRALNETEIQDIYCNQGGNAGFCGGVATLSPLTKLWNFLKGLLTRETGRAITRKAITGNVVKGSDSGNLSKESSGVFGKIVDWFKKIF